MLKYASDHFKVKHALRNFLQGHSQPTLGMGAKLKTCQFKAMLFIVFPFLWTPKDFPAVILT